MIVQPSPLGSRSRPRRAIRRLLPLVPVVLLTAVVGIGLAGPAPEPPPVQVDLPTEPSGVAVVASPAPAPPDAAPTLERTLFPSRMAGLEVHGVRWTVQARNRGLARGVVAVAGYLAMDPPPEACLDGAPGDGDQWCTRSGVLAEQPWTAGDPREADLPPYHLHPQVPPGVRVPFGAMRASSLGIAAQPVVALARFDDARAAACVPAGRHCGQELVIERIAWADGQVVPGVLAMDPGVPVTGLADEVIRAQAAAVESLAPGGYPLLALLVRPGALAQLHPEAAAALRGDRPAWYVRGLHEAGNPNRIDWLVVDPELGAILADGAIATSRLAVDSEPGISPGPSPGG